MFIRLFAKSVVASALIGAIMVAQVAAAEAEQNQETNNWFDKAFEEYLVEYKRYKNCISYSANHFNLDKELMVAILMVEQGLKDPVKENNDGSFDLGMYQINQVRFNEISHFKITPQMLATDQCVNAFMAAYILNNEITKADDYWTGVGNYHYGTWGKYPHNHYKYIQRVHASWIKLTKLN